jgi:hypothetical protein
MKKLKKRLLILLICLPLLSLNAQNNNGLEASVHLGIPTEDISESVNLVYGLDFNYYFIHIAEVLDFGFTGGYINFNGDKILTSESVNVALPDASFLRVGGTGKIVLSQDIYFGLDLGYAIGLDDIDGGLYYQPKVGFYVSNFSLFAYYQKIRTDDRFQNYSSTGLGATYHF